MRAVNGHFKCTDTGPAPSLNVRGKIMDYDKLTVPELKKIADDRGVKYTSKIRKIDLIRAIDDVEFPTVESQHRMMDVSAYSPGTKTIPPVKNFTERQIIRMIRASQSRRYGQNGRGMGAKHYPMRDVLYTVNPDAIKPLSYADRVRHYAVQNGQGLLTAKEFPGAMLTPRQWRRAQHKQNANRAFGTKEARYL